MVTLYSTWPSRAAAEEVARALLARRLIACANIIDGAHSVYRWEGEVRTDAEAIMFAKTQAPLAEAAADAMRALHAYDLPCIVALPISAAGSNPAFLTWVVTETS